MGVSHKLSDGKPEGNVVRIVEPEEAETVAAQKAHEEGREVAFFFACQEFMDDQGHQITVRTVAGEAPDSFPEFIGHGFLEAQLRGGAGMPPQRFAYKFPIHESTLLEAFSRFELWALRGAEVAKAQLRKEMNEAAAPRVQVASGADLRSLRGR